MGEQRTPAIRKPTPAEELARLHPVERWLLRAFETFSSVRLAIVLMLWLMTECAVGTFVEGQVNTPAAKYFVYGTLRFAILLALLALNILCAALSRFPWRRYQTGFVVTHGGLLVMLAGCLLTARNSVDTLMMVPQGETSDTIVDPELERLVVSTVAASGNIETETIPVNLGPFTWGDKVLGIFPWKKGHAEEYRLKGGPRLWIKRFYANCTPQRVHVPADGGPPALEYRLYHPERADLTQWIATDDETRIGAERLMAGSVAFWQLDTAAEFDHFVQAVPPAGVQEGLGSLGYSYQGKHFVFPVESLRKGPVKVPETDVELQVTEYFKTARLDPQGRRWVDQGGDLPQNPMLKIQVRVAGTDLPGEFLAFGDHPEYNRLLVTQFGTEHLFTYFPADIPAVIHLVMTTEGRLGYRAFGSEGLIASVAAQADTEYPCWNGLRFVPLTLMPQSRPDIRLRPKPLERGKEGERGIVVELESGNERATTSLVRDVRNQIRFKDRLYVVGFDVWREKVPFQIRLDAFHEPTNPGTRQAAEYRSRVTLIDKARNIEESHDIYMNHPLYYTADDISYTLYQSGIDRSTGVPISTYTVASDPGLEVKYAGAIILSTGIFLMFYMGGYFRKNAPRPRVDARLVKSKPTPLVASAAGSKGSTIA